MIKVLYLIHALTIGGAETIVKEYAVGLNKNIFDVYILCFDRVDRTQLPYYQIVEDAGVKIINVSDDIRERNNKLINKISRRIKLYQLIKNQLKKIEPDIIHTHLPVNKFVRYSRPNKRTAIFYTHHNSVERWKKFYKSDVRDVKWLKKKYDMTIVALNPTMSKELNMLLRIDDSIILNNGIDINKYQTAKNRSRVRRKLNINEDAFVIGHVGRFSKIKNHSYLIDIFAKAKEVRPDAFLLLIGDGEEKEFIIKKLKSLHLDKDYMLLSNRSDIPDLLQTMDVFVFPSFSEGVPVSLVEAQAAGIKCLVSNNVTNEVVISNIIKYRDISEKPELWVKDIFEWKTKEIEYYQLEKWNMIDIVKKLEMYYINAVRRCRNEENIN